MRVLLVAVGTRGDVQPALAFGLELTKLGHDVRLCTSPNFVDQAAALGLEAVPMGVEMRRPPGAGALPKLTPEELRRMKAAIPDLITDQFDTLAAAVDGCDVIVGANAHQYAAPSIAEYARIPCITAVYAPNSIPSSALAPPPRPGESPVETESADIAAQWRITADAWNERALDRVNGNRRRFGLSAIDDVLDYVLARQTWLATDAALAPVPDGTGRDVFQTGAWVLPDPTPLPAEVDAFLDAGAAPIFVGFGSMPVARDAAREPVAAARALDRRVIVYRGWAELEPLDDGPDCLNVGDLNFDRLFPRVAVVVHHGGAGTTATAARAGAPQVVTPLFGDQFYWAGRITELAAGASVPFECLTQASLIAAVRAAQGSDVQSQARALAGRMGSDGAAIAARHLVNGGVVAGS